MAEQLHVIGDINRNLMGLAFGAVHCWPGDLKLSFRRGCPPRCNSSVRRPELAVMNTVSARAAGPRFDAFDLAALAGRLLMATFFLLCGWAKVTNPAFFIGYAHSAGLPAISVPVAIPVELIGGVLLLIGYRSRITAAVLAVFTRVAASFFHSALGDPNQFNQFFKNVAMAGGPLQVVAFGPGRFSVDVVD